MVDMTEIKNNIHYIYGPVRSWRSGTSLGVDIIGDVSTCSFNCVYCQLGKIQNITNEIKVYVPTEKIMQDLIELERTQQFVYESLDVITFAGSGEPTLAENLGEAISEIRKLYASRSKQVPISILTNATMLGDSLVRERVKQADLISLKLDAVSDEMLQTINQPAPGISMGTIVQGIKALRDDLDSGAVIASPGGASQSHKMTQLQLQIMLMPKYIDCDASLAMTDGSRRFARDDKNNYLNKLAELIAETQINKIQINTPTRPKPVSTTGEYWLDTRGNHYGPGEADDLKPEYIEFRELPVISQEQAFAIEDYLRDALKDRVSELEIVNVYKR